MNLKLRVLDLGRLRLDENFITASSTFATPDHPGQINNLVDIPVSGYFIEHPDGNVLFDTGCHPDAMGPQGRWSQELQRLAPHIGGAECSLPARLAELGFGPDDMRYVVLSHMHDDHAGCVEYFRKSQLIVHEHEFSGALRHFALHDSSPVYIWKDTDAWTRLSLNWRLVSEDETDMDLVEGVRLLNFGSGHAYGMLGLSVNLRSRRGVILSSDACYSSTNYGPPARFPAFLHDSLGYQRTLRRIRALSQASGHEVWFGHDVKQFPDLLKSTDGFYE